ncbi:MAG: HNH endonuclease [Ilumatobacteraceae bacterium]
MTSVLVDPLIRSDAGPDARSDVPVDVWAVDRAMDVVNGRLAELAGQLNVVNARLVEVTETVLVDELWRQGGMRTPSAFLQWRLGVSSVRANDLVTVARRRGEFPVLMGCFERGEFSLEQMAAAVAAPAWADGLIVDFVRISTPSKIRRAMRSDMFTDVPAASDATDDASGSAAPVDRLSFTVTAAGRWRINGEFGLDDGRRIEAALSERRDAFFVDGQSDVTWVEAFVDCMERSLDAVESSSRRDRFRTWVHIDVTDGVATTTDGWRLPDSVRDLVCCDGVVQPVWERDGVPVSVGRSQYVVPDRTRRVVERRDRGCRAPGCGRERHVEIHHIVHWLGDGGPTDTWNLVSLCPHHHRMHHQGLLGISGDADAPGGLVFTDEHGRPVPGVGPPIPPSGPRPPSAGFDPPLAGRFDWDWIGLGWVHPDVRAARAERTRRLT